MKKYLILCILTLFTISSSADQAITSKTGLVVTQKPIATQVGMEILKQGGNAIDAAVAVGYALAVVYPCCGNIGGGGFMLIHLVDGQNIFLNFREKAPLAASANMFLDKHGNVIPKKSTTGYLAAAIPGTVLGLETARQKYGTMSREQLIRPAIELAANGFILTASDINILHKTDFFKNYKTGDRLVQKDLANTLQLISDQGADVFYHGKIAEQLVSASQANGGIFSLKDFANYNVEELKPLMCTYRGLTLYSSPPPSSGGTTLCEMLNILEGFPLSKLGFESVMSAHYTIEAMRFAFADRNNLGDPNFVKNPVALLISKDYAKTLQQLIRARQQPDTKKSILIKEKEQTTHYSIADRFGNAAAVTYTLNGNFGANVIAGNTGIFLNNEMDDFNVKPGVANQFGLVQGDANKIAPGKRPLSSMTPTFVMQNNKLLIVLGSPGGPRIITSVLLTLLNVIDYGMTIQNAVNAPRFHQQYLPIWVSVEPTRFSALVANQLIRMGYQLKTEKPWGAVEAIYIKDGIFYGGQDRRQDPIRTQTQ